MRKRYIKMKSRICWPTMFGISRTRNILVMVGLFSIAGLWVWIRERSPLVEPQWSICIDEPVLHHENGLVGVLLLIDLSKVPDGTLIATTANCDCHRLSVETEHFTELPIDRQYMTAMRRERPLMMFLVEPSAPFAKHCHTTLGTAKRRLVNLVKSSVRNRDQRDAIRATWGAIKQYADVRIDTVFIVGIDDEAAQRGLAEEDAMHGDILQIALHDSTNIAPMKVLAGMQWASTFLKSDTLYASVDDDMVVHIPHLVSFIKSKYTEPKKCKPESNIKHRPCLEDLPLLCVYSYQAKERSWFSKWYKSYDDFPDRQWPAYCRGGIYIAPVKMVDALFRVSRRMEHLYLDDVWITGFMRRKLGMGGNNIVAASHHSVRKGMDFQQPYPFPNTLVQHSWSNTREGLSDVADNIRRVWSAWKIDITTSRICFVSGERKKSI